MSITVVCPSCRTRLQAPESKIGRTAKCPLCQTPVELKPTFRPADQIQPLDLASAPPTSPVATSAVANATAAATETEEPRKRRKKKKKKGFSLPAISIESGLLKAIVGVVVAVVVGYGVYYGIRYAMRVPPPPVIATEQWQAVEVPNRFKCLLPGPAQRQSQSAPALAGAQMISYSFQPDQKSIYSVAYFEGKLPPERRNLSAEQLLNDACDGSAAAQKTQGAFEESRTSIELGGFPGKQLITDIPQAGGKGIARVFLAHGRLYIVMAGGAGLLPDHDNVRRLFNSFEILDQGDAAEPEAPAPPEPPKDKTDPTTPKGPQGPQGPNAGQVASAKRAPAAAAPAKPTSPSTPAAPKLTLPDLPPALPINPAPLAKEVVVLDQPAPIDDLCVGGGGRFIIFHCVDQRRLNIFDVNAAKIIRSIPLSETKVHFAAGMNQILVALPNAHKLELWGIVSNEFVPSAPIPFKGPILGLSMGSASAGPAMLIEQALNSRPGGAHFLDLATLKLVSALKEGEQVPGIVPHLVRASGDGRVFAWRTSTGSEGHEMATLVLDKSGATIRRRGMGDYLLTPGPDGRDIFCISGILDHEWEPVFPRPSNTNLYRPYIPALQGSHFLQLLSFEFDRPMGRKGDGDIVIFDRRSKDEVLRLKDIEGVKNMSLAYGNVGGLAYDQRILFIPDARLLVTIPVERTRLILRRVELPAQQKAAPGS